MQPALSMRRLAAVTLIVFVLVLAFLAGRVRAGADPTQAGTPASAPQTQTSPDVGSPGYGAPGDTVVPDQGDGAGSAIPDGDPPVTQAS
jgi:hypothetical protein